MELPLPFVKELSAALPEAKAAEVISAIGGEPTTAVRLNPLKLNDIRVTDLPVAEGCSSRTFSAEGYFLSSRPQFAADPLFHAGAYYVQEASSMYLESISGYMSDLSVKRGNRPFAVLDLCAAPGGKTTHLLSMMAGIPDSVLVSNEVIRSRTGVLCENVGKWGYSNVLVTNEDPAAFGSSGHVFDVVAVDAPCSGEGMFRKDPESVKQWSMDNVALCAARQKRILEDVLPSLRPGGLLVYSTCTFNRYEDEDIVAMLSGTYGMEVMDMRHFYPGEPMAGEGFFFALLRKPGEYPAGPEKTVRASGLKTVEVPFVREGFRTVLKGNRVLAMPEGVADWMVNTAMKFKTLQTGCLVASSITGTGGKSLLLPEHPSVQGETYARGYFQEHEVTLEVALNYVSRGLITLPEMPVGYVLLTYKGIPLGLVKNLGRRCNNLWPENLRLRKSF